jgi:hypothetical protein
MTRLLRLLTGRDQADRALAGRLRDEARAFDPAVPVGLRRRVFSKLARQPAIAAGAASGSQSLLLRALGAVGLAAAVVALIFVARPGRPTAIDRPKPPVIVKAPTPYAFAAADPDSLARRWVDQPIEAEIQSLMSGLSQAGETVAGVLPAAPKRAAKADGGGGA